MAETILLIGPDEEKQVKIDQQNLEKPCIERVLRDQERRERTPFLRWELAIADDNEAVYINRAVFGEVDNDFKLGFELEAFDFADKDASDDTAKQKLFGRIALDYAQARLDGNKRRLLITRPVPKIAFVNKIVVIANSEHQNFGGRHEDTPEAKAIIDKYWAKGLEAKNTGDAWSAAFVSYVMRTAGLTRSQFAFGAAHAVYITAAFKALRISNANHNTYAYVPKRLAEHEPKPGDLICSWYDGQVTYDMAAAATSGYFSHCDIVVENTGTEIVVIGGNVSQTVTKRNFALQGGRLTTQAFPKAFAVLANRFAVLQPAQGEVPALGEGFNINTNLKTTKSQLTADRIRAFFDAQPADKRKLRDIGGAVMDAVAKYGINAAYIVAHAILESGWGTSRFAEDRHNLFGWGARDANPDEAWAFQSFAECIDIVMGRINELYLRPGGSFYHTAPVLGDRSYGMNANYATDPKWGKKIADLARQIER